MRRGVWKEMNDHKSMHLTATNLQMKELDHIAIHDYGIPSLTLMERAAQAVADRVISLMGSLMADKPIKAAVFCGPGNNGGDGIAVSRLLLAQGYEVCTFLIGNREKMTEDAKAMEEKLVLAGGALRRFDAGGEQTLVWLEDCRCMVDALFGVGLKRPVMGDFLAAVRQMNHRSCPLVACDIPSGVDGDTGEILGEAIRADWTVTFTCGKWGLYKGEGRRCAGTVEVADIGIPKDLIRQIIREPIG